MVVYIIIAALLIWFGVKIIPFVLSQKGASAYSAGNFEKAEKYLKKAAEIFGGSPAYANSYAVFLMKTGNFEKAEVVLNGIVLGGGKKPMYLITAKVYRALARHKLGRLDEALEDAKELYEKVKTTSVYALLGLLSQENGDAALDLCLEAYDYNSDDRDICDNLAVSYIMTGDLEKAEEIASGLREKYANFTEGFYHSAQIAFMRGDKKTAMEYLDSAQKCTKTALSTVSDEKINKLKEEIENA